MAWRDTWQKGSAVSSGNRFWSRTGPARCGAQIVADPDMRERLPVMGMEPAEDTTPEALANLMKSFAQRNAALMDAAKMKPE